MKKYTVTAALLLLSLLLISCDRGGVSEDTDTDTETETEAVQTVELPADGDEIP